MSKKKKLAILASCMVMCSAGFVAAAGAEEAENSGDNGDVVLEEVVVTAAAFKQLNPVKFTVITEEQIKAKGAQNAAEALNDVTGLYITSNSTSGKAVAQFRGSDADNTKIFVDGVPLSPVADGKVDLRAIPADNIAKIEVIKGAVPVIYGSDAPGGIIYIVTKNAPEKKATALTITSGTNNDEKYYLTMGGKKGKMGYNFGYKREDTRGYTVHSQLEGDYFNGKLSWDLNEKSSLSLFGSYSKRTEEIPNRIDPLTGAIVKNPGKGGVISGRNSYWSDTFNWKYDPIENIYTGALYSQKLDKKSDLSLKMYRSNEKSHMSAENWACNIGGIDHIGHQYWDGTVRGLELQDTIRTSRNNTLTLGYNYETRDFTERLTYITNIGPNGQVIGKHTEYMSSNYDYTGKSFYVQDVTHVNSRLSTSFGYRHDEHNDNADINTWAWVNPTGALQYGHGSADNPVFSFNYALSNETNLHGSVGTSYRWPNAKERSGPGGYYNGEVCNYLLPEEAINRELGMGYTAHGLKFDVTFFSRDITNMIKGQGFGQRHTQYYNIPHVDMQGYEVEVNKKIHNGLKAFINYSYTDAYDTLLKDQVRDIPKHKYSLGLNYVGADGVNANLAVNYLGSKVSTFSNGNGNGDGENVDVPTNLITQKIPGYTTVDLKVSKAVDNQDYWVRFLNIFDKKYYQGCYLTGPGRYIEVGMTIKM